MAQPMICDGPDDDPAAYVVTMIDQAETVAFCPPCMADFAQAYLQAIDPSRLAPPPKPAAKRSRAKAPAAVAAAPEGGAPDGASDDGPPGKAASVG